MVIPALVAAAAVAMLGWLVFMVARPGSMEESIEREVAQIRREAERGLADWKICEHHPDFCECQVAYLRARSPVVRT